MHNITHANEILFREAFTKTLSSITATSIADIGSGDGSYSMQIGKMVGAKKIVCIDHDQKALLHAKKIGCNTVFADLNNALGIASKSFDLVLSNQVIEHIAKTDLLASEVYRILKVGGKSLWCTPNLASWHNVVALAAGFQPFSSQISDQAYLGNPWHPDYKKPIHEEQAHLRVFTIRSLTELLLHHGFSIESAQGIGYYPFSGKVAQAMSRFDHTHAAYILVSAVKK